MVSHPALNGVGNKVVIIFYSKDFFVYLLYNQRIFIMTETINSYEIIDPDPSKDSLSRILDLIQLLDREIKLTPGAGHYSGGYHFLNGVWVTGTISFQELIRSVNRITQQNGSRPLRVLMG